MPDPKYQPTSYGFAATAVAEDLDRIAAELRSATSFTMAYGAEAAITHAFERLEMQAAALREIALKSFRDDWPKHIVVPAEAEVWADQTGKWDAPGGDFPPPGGDDDEYERLVARSLGSGGDGPMPSVGELLGDPPIDPDAEGPSWDDSPDEPRRR